MNFSKTRALYLIMFCLVLVAWAISIYLQVAKGMHPCALCIIQRMLLMGIGIIALIAFLHDPIHWGHKIYAFLMLILSLIGIYASGFQMWLQHHPHLVHTCTPPMKYLLKEYSLPEVISIAFKGGTDCSQIHLHFLSLTMPGWSAVLFIYMALVCIGILIYYIVLTKRQ